jgi:hypothetical protein
MSSRICLVSVIGIFEYILVMSSDASLNVGGFGVFFQILNKFSGIFYIKGVW